MNIPPVEAALELAAAGFPVFACGAKKKPIIKNGFLDATTNPVIIKRMFTKAAKLIGVPTGPVSGIDCLDFDYRNGAKDWEDNNIERFPETRIHQTRSGGRHLLFRCDPRVRNSESRIAKGIDVRGSGGYIITPPSDGYHVIHEAALAPWPEFLLQPGLALPKPRPVRPVSSTGPYTPTANIRLEGYRKALLKNVSSAGEGQKHYRLRNAALALGGIQQEAGFSDEEAIGWLMQALPSTVADWKNAETTAAWALAKGREEPIKLEDRHPATASPRYVNGHDIPRQEPAREPPPEIATPDGADDPDEGERPWDSDQDDHAGAENQSGDKAAEQPKPNSSTEDPVEAVVDEFNAKYMLVNESGKAIIYAPGFEPVLKRNTLERMKLADLRALYMNRSIQIGMDDKKRPVYKPAADVWLKNPRRRQYINGVTFDPSNRAAPDGVLNLWQSFAVKPKPGDWSLLRAHIKTILCSNDPVRHNYIMGWLAQMFQHPDQQGEVATVLKGGEGIGKGTLAKVIMRIVGQHGLAISNAKHLVGNFNSHLRDVIFLFADEAFFAGDKQHVGALKSLITEPYLTIEAKYSNAVQVPNFLHVLMASNEEWVVPAAADARRYFVLEVSEARKNDHAYFGAIWQQMEDGGFEAMLHDLLAMDLTTFNIRDVPATEGLHHQRKLSLPTTDGWWLDCLERGYVFRSKHGLEEHFATWHDKISTELLFASYVEYARSHGERHLLSRESLGRFFTKMKACPARWRSGVVGEHITDVENPYGRTNRKAALIRDSRCTGYKFGTLETARTNFCGVTGIPVTWDGGHVEPEDDDIK
jgi:hypothetical protein